MSTGYVGMRGWVPRFVDRDSEDGFNATITRVNGEINGCLCALVEIDGLSMQIAVKENYDFFWAKPSSDRPRVKVPVTKWGRVYRHKATGKIEVATGPGSYVTLADQEKDVEDRKSANPEWEYLGIQPITVQVLE